MNEVIRTFDECLFSSKTSVFVRFGRANLDRIAKNIVHASCILLPALPLLLGCGSSPPEIDTRTIEVQVGPAANHNSAVALDICYVFNEQLLTQVQTLSAKDWFKQRGEIRSLYPKDVVVSSYELVPGQRGPIEKVTSKNEDAIGVFAFANYQDEGAHRARLDRFEYATVQLNETDLAIAPSSK